ncbi:unnamed protein product [Sphagnum troendelagicum]|uniref:E3 SUMO-protein ligase SIZ1 n=1 Tax=Sphagnum troendelagicum TaxID=128251 RepID=A0ABP0T9I7_9BRYO
MDDLAIRCQNQLVSLRIKELKDVLSRLGLPKQGKKQGVVLTCEMVMIPLDTGLKTIKNAISREEAATIVNDMYRKVQRSVAPDLASAVRSSNNIGGSSSLAHSDEQDEVVGWDEAKTRCPCGNTVDTGTMIQCDSRTCGVWQHLNCVVISDKPSEGVKPEIPSSFYCDLCRITHCDPFCVALSHPLLPTKLTTSFSKMEGSNPLQNVEKSFTLTRGDRDLLKKDTDLQVWCVLLNDKVPFRMHWPAYSDLRINGVAVRVTNRPGQQLLGANGRDEGPGITAYTREGLNRLSFSAYDARAFCLGVRIVRRNSLQEVMQMIPAVAEGEAFEDAMTRLRRCINGGVGSGGGLDDEDDDSDLEVVAESITVNLRCPMSGSRIKVAGRFKPCLHIGCFDLDTFVEINQRARKWQCPICLRNYSIDSLIRDPLFNKIISAMKDMGEDVTEVELKAEGLWRPKLEGDARLHEPWQTICCTVLPTANGSGRPNCAAPQQQPLKPVKVEQVASLQERVSLRLGIKRTLDGVWTVNGSNKPLNGWADAGPSKRVKSPPELPQSSSATDGYGEQEDGNQSVNQEPSERDVDYTEDASEVRFPKTTAIDPVPGIVWQTAGCEIPNIADVVVLSDSDDDEPVLGSSSVSAYLGNEVVGHMRLPSPGVIIPADPIDTGNSSGNELGLQMEDNNFWSASFQDHPDLPYGFFSGPDPPVMGQQHHPGPVRPTAIAGGLSVAYGLPSPLFRDEPARVSSGWTRLSQHLPAQPYSSMEHNGGIDDNDRVASPSESALHLFLPPQPARVQVPPPVELPIEQEEMDNAWFSLSLGGGNVENPPAAPPPSVPSTSAQELHRPVPKARGDLQTFVSRGFCRTGKSSMKFQRRGRSRSPIRYHPIATRPRSSPTRRRCFRHRFRVDDSNSSD